MTRERTALSPDSPHFGQSVSAASLSEELDESPWYGRFRLPLYGDVPVLRALEALLEVARGGDRVRVIAAWDDERRQVEAQELLRLGARRGVAVEERTRRDGQQQPVRVRIQFRVGVSERALATQHRHPRSAAGIGAERLVALPPQFHDTPQPVPPPAPASPF